MGSGNDTAASANMTLTMSSMPHVLFTPFRVEPEPVVRRMAFWFFLAGLLLFFLMIVLCYLAIQPGEAIRRLLPACLILWVIALYNATYHQRVDDEGIWECALFFRRGWLWERFSSDHIYRTGNTFFDAKCKWWQADRCSLDLFSEPQRADVLEHIHQLWRPSPLAEQLQLHTFAGWHRSLEIKRRLKFDNQWLKVTFIADGIVLDSSAKNAVVELLPWSEVRSIDVIQSSRYRSVPAKMMVRFRNAREPLPFYLHETNKGTLCQLVPCLFKWSVSGTVEQLSFEGPIRSVREALFRKLHLRRQSREFRNTMRMLSGLFLVTWIIIIVSDEFNVLHKWYLIAVTAVIYAAFLITALIKYRSSRRCLQEPVGVES
jgi:Ca2+/Na+ antiporter